MTAKIINGREVSEKIRNTLRDDVKSFQAEKGRQPKLVVIIVGSDPASKVYVKNKKIACEKTGFLSDLIEYPSEITEKELLLTISELNNDRAVDGILVQLPLPSHINEKSIIQAISPLKDVDCFHPENVGYLFQGDPVFAPCTPGGIISLLKEYNLETAGKHVVIIGRSNIVGKPMASLMLMKGAFGDATVTICHSRTKKLKELTLQADIIVAAIGRADFLKGDMVSENTVVIDVGINRVDDASEKGYYLCGDVKYSEVCEKASYITPVPGGVGPMTITTLLQNTLKAAQLKSEE